MLQFKAFRRATMRSKVSYTLNCSTFWETKWTTQRDELGLGGQKEEVPQQEIGTSKIDYQVSTRPIPDSSILAEASLANVQKMEVDPSGHIESVHEPILEHINKIGSLGDTLT
jgi:hypothetical protein